MLARILLFCSSYVPLFVIFAIRFERTAWLWWSVSGIFLAFAIIIFLLVLRRHEPQFYRVEIVDENAAAAAYVATYVLPFVTVNEPTGRDLIAYLVFFIVVAILNVRSSLAGVNPLVYFTPWRIYQIQTATSQAYILFARTRPKSGELINASRAFSGLLVVKGSENDE